MRRSSHTPGQLYPSLCRFAHARSDATGKPFACYMFRYHTPQWAQVDLLHVTWLCAVPVGGPKQHHNICGQSVICRAPATTYGDLFHVTQAGLSNATDGPVVPHTTVGTHRWTFCMSHGLEPGGVIVRATVVTYTTAVQAGPCNPTHDELPPFALSASLPHSLPPCLPPSLKNETRGTSSL